MAIRFLCPSCQSRYQVSDEDGGRTGPCHTCGVVLQVPFPHPSQDPQIALIASAQGLPRSAERITFHCPNCQVQYSLQSSDAGKRAQCKTCGSLFVVPTSSQSSGFRPTPVSSQPQQQEEVCDVDFEIASDSTPAVRHNKNPQLLEAQSAVPESGIIKARLSPSRESRNHPSPSPPPIAASQDYNSGFTPFGGVSPNTGVILPEPHPQHHSTSNVHIHFPHQAPPPQSAPRCVYCGSTVVAGSQFCVGCGRPLRGQAAQFAQAVHPQTAQGLPQSPVIVNIHNSPTHSESTKEEKKDVSVGELIALYVLSFIIPFFGFLGALVLLFKGKFGHALFLILITLMAMGFWGGFLSGIQ